ncbi:hypothetical protein [Halosolutus gelatinilyticus]|uniref:hypothetical protein n=1 Tax=Halosolutus gelatinilyticus TaxID=2931975 RepID=UPI002AB19964|nr:hypothetical protein [Halosolutus gelatinilyticus]
MVMNVRAPSLRSPRTFYDVFGIVVVSITIMAAILRLWHGTVVRVEMLVFIVLVFLWVIWAMMRILERSATRR